MEERGGGGATGEAASPSVLFHVCVRWRRGEVEKGNRLLLKHCGGGVGERERERRT